MKNNAITVQLANGIAQSDIPIEDNILRWVNTTLDQFDLGQRELTIRFVDESESQALNNQYRQKDKPTNVLSFPFEVPDFMDLPLLGDIVICVPVIATESSEQAKPIDAHYAHMIVHGCLHLLGYDHQSEDEADEMESLEVEILAKLGIDDPYEDH